MKKVLGFDNWTGGARHFARLVEAFRQRDLDLHLVHLGSWGNDPGRPVTETIDGLDVKDVSWYGNDPLRRILDVEQPSVVLFFSTDTFAHRAFNRYCRQRRVPTLHVYHGVVRVQAVDGGVPYKVSLLSQVRFAMSKVLKALRYVWPQYARALWATRAPGPEWLRFMKDIFVLASGKYIGRSAADAQTDRCCVYVDGDVPHAMSKYGFSRDRVKAVGNPDLIHFGLSADRIGERLYKPVEGQHDVMYIDTALLLTGWVYTSADEFVQHLVDTRNSLALAGKHMVYKPHPALLRTSMRDTFREAGLDICADGEFVDRLARCEACITETSSLALVPALMGIPLLLARYGRVRSLEFGEILLEYPRSRYLDDIDSFETTLADELQSLDIARTRAWIDSNAGPLPAEAMPERVANVICDMIESNTVSPQTS